MVRAKTAVFLCCVALCTLFSLIGCWPGVAVGASQVAVNFTTQGPGGASNDAALFGVHEITLTTGNGGVANPHDTDFRVIFTSPSGSSVTVNGFYDGGTTWSARVYVTEVGSWTWSTSSTDDTGLHNRSGSFSAVSSNLRGKLRKHPENNQRWATEDGRFFLAMADTPYVLFNDDCSTHFNPSCTEDLFHRYVQQIAAKGVALLRVGYGGGYSGWTPNRRTSDSRYPRANWIHDGWDYAGFDLSQLQKSDERLAWLLNNYPGIYVDLHLLPKNNDPGLKWFQDLTEAERNRTMKVLLARLAAFPNILFLIERDIRHNYSPEDKVTLNEPNLSMCRLVGTYLAQNDPWDTLRGCNEKPREYNQLTLPSDFDTWASYLEVEHWGYPHATAVDWYYDNLAYLPVHVFHGEDAYEQPWSGGPQNPSYYYRRLFWSALLSGGSGAYGSRYKTITPYDETGTTDYWFTNGLSAPDRTQLTGLDEAIHIKEFFEQYNIDLADFTPDDRLGLHKNSVSPEANNGPSKVQVAHDGNTRYLFYHPNAADGEEESPDITLETGALVETRYNASLRLGRTPGIIADLSAGSGRTYDLVWFHPTTGQSFSGDTVSGGGTVTLTAPSAFSGSDAVLFLREIAHDSAACIDFGDDVTFDFTAVQMIEIGGTTSCTEYDQISVANTLTINSAALEVVLINSFVPQYGDRFDVLDWGTLVGSFGPIDTSAAALPYPLTWDLSQLHLTGELVVGVQQFADGDLAPWDNPDGQVNAADVLIAVQLALGRRTPGPLQFAHGDMNVDGVIDLADVLLIQQAVLQ